MFRLFAKLIEKPLLSLQFNDKLIIHELFLRPTTAARTREHRTRNCHWNINQNPEALSQVSFGNLKRKMNFYYSGFSFEFRSPFRVSSCRERHGKRAIPHSNGHLMEILVLHLLHLSSSGPHDPYSLSPIIIKM